MANTTAFIKALRLRVNEIIPTYYEEAPSKYSYAAVCAAYKRDTPCYYRPYRNTYTPYFGNYRLDITYPYGFT